MVPSENEEILRVFDLVREEQAYGFQRLLPSVYVVSEEEIVGLGWKSSVFEEAEEVVVLTVYISANLFRLYHAQHPLSQGTTKPGFEVGDREDAYRDRSLEFQQYRLRDEDLTCFRSQVTNFCFQELYLLARSASPHLQQSIDDGI